ncbi:hypothetical protein QJS04_geneDACA010404 [Acorus gramineus]|uniref:C2H2-type domain-containing protein n=1 Tax=Acorus gramineus TaxID=55184 RepID=A0AAV9A6D0_ACOGR|nr:hypothetical protein QJS04_geneDACA010404 [Acorus gramineus]
MENHQPPPSDQPTPPTSPNHNPPPPRPPQILHPRPPIPPRRPTRYPKIHAPITHLLQSYCTHIGATLPDPIPPPLPPLLPAFAALIRRLPPPPPPSDPPPPPPSPNQWSSFIDILTSPSPITDDEHLPFLSSLFDYTVAPQFEVGESSRPPPPTPPPPPRAFVCRTCGIAFPNVRALGGHVSSHTRLRRAAEIAKAEVEAKRARNGPYIFRAGPLQIGGRGLARPAVPPAPQVPQEAEQRMDDEEIRPADEIPVDGIIFDDEEPKNGASSSSSGVNGGD